MRIDLRTKFLLLGVALAGAVLFGVWFGLDALLAREGVSDAARGDLLTVVYVAAGCAAVLAVVFAMLAVRFVRATLSSLTQAIERGRSVDAAFPDELLSELAATYRRLASDLVRVDSSLAEEHSRFQAVLNGIDAGVFAVDGEGRITLTNTAFLEMFEIAESPVGRRYREVVPLAALHDAVLEAQQGRLVRTELRVPGTQPRTIVANASPQGTGHGAAVVLRDVSAVRHLERVRRDFVANISHELRTPVSVIQTSAETLLDGALEDPVHAREFASRIERHASRMSQIIAGLLDLARLEAGQQSLAKESVNVRASVERALDLVQASARDKGLEVEVEVDPELTVHADQKGVDQVLSNLVVNAVKYADAGGSIRIEADAKKGWVKVMVADEGPGIAPEHRERVFERFYRIDKGRSRETGGTGLGLAIVKHLTLAMGGTVGVEPREPRGSTFWVRLPAGREAPHPIA
jgi:two-component system phosphate regulon sensor histidine kinase PhoR